MARIGITPWDWSPNEIPLFDPVAARAYGRFMHDMNGPDKFNLAPPPAQITTEPEHDGWAYGAFLLQRFTTPTWDERTRELDLYYLMSTSTPYQVQLMRTRIRLD